MTADKSIAPLIVILGPTASGKSTLGVWLAERIGGEVVACDSTQLYKGFDIGTAKPSLAERRGVPHHLIDVLEPYEPATAGGYREAAIATLDDLRRRGRVPILTVGTGLYLRALLEGLADVPQRSEELRDRLRISRDRHPAGYLHRVLRRLDPNAASKIAAADEQKLIRAIEVCLLTKRPLTQVYREGRAPLTGWRSIKIGLKTPREELYERIHARTDSMLVRDWLDEVRTLMNWGLTDHAKPFDFIGYRELRAVARGEMQLADAQVAIQQATRRYAKRQITWFRREANVQWLDGFGDSPKIQVAALDFVTESLKG
ncbi:MAG TPA: tRNA (adenosine(37)-N6)-dimethylallyltransferase MiaA [Candidatus Acidoferrum sp.]|nr:tRNA (adenosine(37)-N6)-dimethylallyltransferase MiaA [Candidatus Acidoferrum sp.]